MSCFKAYDIRGRVPDELNEELAYRIGRAFVDLFAARSVAVGRDVRLSGPAIAGALTEGLRDGGAEVWDLGLVGTELIYFATAYYGLDGGIMVTASHNPSDYNGMKLVRAGARPVSGDTGLRELEGRAAQAPAAPSAERGGYREIDAYGPYVERLLDIVDTSALGPLTVVCDAGNGGAGMVVDRLAPHLPFELVRVRHEPDGRFPNGVPNPLLPENRTVTEQAVRETRADLGVAWDGDYDRCFLFDENGAFIEGYYIVGLLAQAALDKHPGSKVIHDPRLTWNTREIVEAAGGVAIQSKTGHAFIKERMRAEDAVYGGEMSAHHYFRDFAYCDTGMLPWLLIAELIAKTGKPLSALVSERRARYPVSGEINRSVPDPAGVLERVRARYGADAVKVETTDGLGVEYPDWRFNLRGSNTEPLLRLNVETRADPELLESKTRELLDFIDACSHE